MRKSAYHLIDFKQHYNKPTTDRTSGVWTLMTVNQAVRTVWPTDVHVQWLMLIRGPGARAAATTRVLEPKNYSSSFYYIEYY